MKSEYALLHTDDVSTGDSELVSNFVVAQFSIVEHSQYSTMTFERWLEIYEKHTHSHIDQMRKNYEAWKASR